MATPGSVRLGENLCYELSTGSNYEDEFYSYAVPRCRAIDRSYDDAFKPDGTLQDGTNAFTVFEVKNFMRYLFKKLMKIFRNLNVERKQSIFVLIEKKKCEGE